MSTCSPSKDAQVVAESVVTGCPCIVAWEEGEEKMDGSKTPARRVFSFGTRENFPTLSDDGWLLTENSILWALGQLGVAVDPREAITTTWGTLKTHYQ